MMRVLLASALVLGALASPALAIDPNAGIGGAAFLQIQQGSAREMALGDSSVATADGADALLVNPADLGVTQQQEAVYSYMSYVQGVATPLFLGYAHPMGRTVWGANMSYLGVNNFDVRDANGVSQAGTNVQVRDGFGTLGVARSFWYEKFFLGAALREVHEDNAGNIHDTLVGDFGALARPNNVLSLAFAYQNFGTNVANVASEVRGGAGFRLGDFVNLGLEVNKAADRAVRAGIGAEFLVPEEYLELGQVSFRAGWYTSDNLGISYSSALTNLQLQRSSGLSFGFGLFTSQAFGYGLGIDYAFVPFGALGTIDQISLKVKF